MLHLTRVAFACASPEDLAQRLASRGPVVHLSTRNRPKRHAELIGGSIYWILKHRLIGRSEILGFGDAEDGRTDILIRGIVIPTAALPKRAHQGWRYLDPKDAPPDLGEGAEGVEDLPAGLAGDLASMGLI